MSDTESEYTHSESRSSTGSDTEGSLKDFIVKDGEAEEKYPDVGSVRPTNIRHEKRLRKKPELYEDSNHAELLVADASPEHLDSDPEYEDSQDSSDSDYHPSEDEEEESDE